MVKIYEGSYHEFVNNFIEDKIVTIPIDL